MSPTFNHEFISEGKHRSKSSELIFKVDNIIPLCRVVISNRLHLSQFHDIILE